MSTERRTEWRVTYPYRLDPTDIWVERFETEREALRAYEFAIMREPGRRVELQRITWQVVETETVGIHEGAA